MKFDRFLSQEWKRYATREEPLEYFDKDTSERIEFREYMVTDGDTVIASVDYSTNKNIFSIKNMEQQEAVGALIMAAPKMLRAITVALASVKACPDGYNYTISAEVMDSLHEAIS